MKVYEVISEHKKGVKAKKYNKKPKKPAAYGPGPMGMYGTNTGFSGDGGAVGEDWGHNEPPPGPEFKPTMPKGTVRVDVSDVYDWYKLGQYISNLKNADKSQFGKGPPSTILSFGSEEEEHEYIKALQNLGLDITDIDPKYHGDKKGVKTDPTFNVGEAVAAPATHTVKFGDTLYSVATKYKMPVDALKKLNGLTTNNIKTGQTLKLSQPAKNKPKPAQQPKPNTTTNNKAAVPVRKGQAAMPAPKPPSNVKMFNKHEMILFKYATASGITGDELAQLLAQCQHETQDWTHLKEFGGSLDFRKYDPKYAPKKAKELGNIKPGDGARYKGRGYIQLTGRYNYKRAGEALGLPLEQKPELVERPDIAAKVAIWFWQNRVKPNVMNWKNTREVTKPINPGLRGLVDRHENFKDWSGLIS